MHAFEEVVAAILERSGYWVRASVKVELSREEKREIGRHTSPRWELDLVGYHAARNEVLVLECKSYLDSEGVRLIDLESADAKYASRYKLFTEPKLFQVVARRLTAQLIERGSCRRAPKVRLGLAVGKVARNTAPVALAAHFKKNGWLLWSPTHIVGEIKRLAADGYDNSAASMVAKLLLRPSESR